MANWTATSSRESTRSDNDIETEDYVCCYLDWLSFILDNRRRLNDITRLLTNHERTVSNKAIPIFHLAVDQDPALQIVDWAHIVTAIFVMCKVMFPFYTQLGKIVYFAFDYENNMADMMNSRKNWVYKEWKPICFSFGFIVLLFLHAFFWSHVFPISFGHSFVMLDFVEW